MLLLVSGVSVFKLGHKKIKVTLKVNPHVILPCKQKTIEENKI